MAQNPDGSITLTLGSRQVGKTEVWRQKSDGSLVHIGTVGEEDANEGGNCCDKGCVDFDCCGNCNCASGTVSTQFRNFNDLNVRKILEAFTMKPEEVYRRQPGSACWTGNIGTTSALGVSHPVQTFAHGVVQKCFSDYLEMLYLASGRPETWVHTKIGADIDPDVCRYLAELVRLRFTGPGPHSVHDVEDFAVDEFDDAVARSFIIFNGVGRCVFISNTPLAEAATRFINITMNAATSVKAALWSTPATPAPSTHGLWMGPSPSTPPAPGGLGDFSLPSCPTCNRIKNDGPTPCGHAFHLNEMTLHRDDEAPSYGEPPPSMEEVRVAAQQIKERITLNQYQGRCYCCNRQATSRTPAGILVCTGCFDGLDVEPS